MPPIIKDDDESLLDREGIDSELSDVLSLPDDIEEVEDIEGELDEGEFDEEEDFDEEGGEVEEGVEGDEGEEGDEDEEEEEEDIPSVSDEEENYKLEDPDEIDEDLELIDDEEEDEASTPVPPPAVKAFTKPASAARASAPVIPQKSVRESRKRNLTYYEEDEDDDDDDAEEDEVEVQPKRGKKVSVPRIAARPAPEELDEDLILTDEETEYNPHAHPDVTKMTERQRARYQETYDDSADEYMTLDALEAQKRGPSTKKKETEQEAALRKAENNRRRLDYKNKQLEEEKRDTLNKLLKRRANKTREVQKGDVNDDANEDENSKSLLKPRRPEFRHPALFRWVNSVDNKGVSSVLGIP